VADTDAFDVGEEVFQETVPSVQMPQL
jgi:hypothetical protein